MPVGPRIISWLRGRVVRPVLGLARQAGQAARRPGRRDAPEPPSPEQVRALTERLEEADRRLAEIATTDELTGLGNRRHFDQLLDRELECARRHGTSLSLVVLDIDYLKALSANYGHAFSDRVLVQVARLLRSLVRTFDILARCSGDDFLILMPYTTTSQAAAAAERVRTHIEKYNVPYGRRSVQITASLGIGCVDATGAIKADRLFRLADSALCAAKRAGGNCVRAWNAVEGPCEGGRPAHDDVEELRRRVASLSHQAKEIFFQSLWSLVQALEARDPYTRNHSENVMRYALGIAETMGIEPSEIDVIRRAATIHDVGKIGIPDAILGKAMALTPEERRLMEQHSLIGVQILDQMRFLDREIVLVRHHHERWDGRGYPDGLRGTAIPLGARVLAVADAFDAITSKRTYRPERSVAEAIRILRQEAGRQFDPAVVDAMLRWISQLHGLAGQEGTLHTADLLAHRGTRAVEIPSGQRTP